MDPGAIFAIVFAIVSILLVWGWKTWREQQAEQRRREHHADVADGVLDRFEAEFGEGALARQRSPMDFHTWFEGELEGRRVELEVESASERDARIRLTIYQGPIDLPEALIVHLKTPSGIGFFKRREAGMVDKVNLPDVENGYLDVESRERRTDGAADPLSDRFLEVLAAHYANFHVAPPEDLTEKLGSADSLQDLERTFDEIEAENPKALQLEVPSEVDIRHDRIELAWLSRGDPGYLEGLLEFVHHGLQLADDLEDELAATGTTA
jgi:hypothetical protein